MSEADEKRIIEAAKKFEEYRSNVGGWHRHLIADYIATRKAECEYWQSKLKEVTLKLDSVQDNNHGLRILMKEMAKHLNVDCEPEIRKALRLVEKEEHGNILRFVDKQEQGKEESQNKVDPKKVIHKSPVFIMENESEPDETQGQIVDQIWWEAAAKPLNEFRRYMNEGFAIKRK